MATAAIPLKELNDITECPICCEVLTDPRVLPCIHTYCLQCLQDLCRDKEPGDEVACSLCRKRFVIPTNGVSDLPKNFFVMKRLNWKQLSGAESKQSPCEACLSEVDGKATDEIKSAVVYCVECHEKLCEDCDKSHRKLKATRGHKIVALGEEIKDEEFYSKHSTTSCDIHPAESLKLYCFDCKLVICMMCYVEQHNSHKCSDIGKVAEEFMQKIRRSAGRLVEGMEKYQGRVSELQNERCDLVEQIDKVEKEICDKAEQLKKMIERNKQELLSELSSLRDDRLKEIDSVCGEIERHSVTMQGLKKYIDEVVKKGTVCDIVRTARSLHDRTDELLVFSSIQLRTTLSLDQLRHDVVYFTSSSIGVDDVKKSFGEITVTSAKLNQKRDAAVIHTQHLPDRALAVTSLRNQLFVLFATGNQVAIYDNETFTLQQLLCLNLPPGRISSLYGLAACDTNNCIYVSESYIKMPIPNNAMRRMELSGRNAVTTWTLTGLPRALSLNSAGNVIVVCHGYKFGLVREYTTHGSLVREIRLQGGFAPWQAVELSDNQFAVTSCNTSHGVYIVDADGEVIHRYSEFGAQTGPLKNPRSLVVTKTGFILVADSGNNRILRMDRTLSSAQQLDLPVELGELQEPCGLWMDESRGRLYVAEDKGKRLLVFDNVSVD